MGTSVSPCRGVLLALFALFAILALFTLALLTLAFLALAFLQGLTLVPISAQVELFCPPCNPA
jgi:hypothetical protein